MAVRLIDISSNNGRHIDFPAVKRAGIDGVYIKVTQGTNYVNPYAADHAREAKAAGLLVGAYCFASPASGRTGGQEADYFLGHARAAGLLEKGCLRPAVDIEITALPKGKPSRQYDYALIERVIHRLGPDTFNAFDSRPLIYTASWFWDAILGARNAHKCPLWLAAYTPIWRKLVPVAFKRLVSFHQYTDKQRVAGAGSFDGDLYLGKDLKTLKHRHTLRRNA